MRSLSAQESSAKSQKIHVYPGTQMMTLSFGWKIRPCFGGQTTLKIEDCYRFQVYIINITFAFPDAPCMDCFAPVLCGQNGHGGTFVEMAAGKNSHPIGRIWDMHTQVCIHHFHHIVRHYLLSLLFIPYIYY